MAGAGFKDFQAGAKLTANEVDTYLMQQSVMRFADSSARSSAIGTAIAEGMVSYLDSTNNIEVYDGAAWNPVSAGATSPNYILNADMTINQRGFSTNTASSGPGMMNDMWRGVATGNANSFTYSIQDLAPGTISVAQQGSKHLRCAVSGLSTSTHYAVIWQKIENARLLAGQTVTVSFYAKSVSGTAKIASSMLRLYGTGGSPSTGEFVIEAQTFDLTTSWARYSYTATIPSDSGKTYGTNNDSHLRLDFTIAAGVAISGDGGVGITDRTTDIWGVQVEVGSSATAFRNNQPNPQAELAACQRYYITTDASPSTTMIYGGTSSGGFSPNAYHSYRFPVQMRTTPTITFYAHDGTAGAVSLYVSGTPIKSTSVASIGASPWGWSGNFAGNSPSWSTNADSGMLAFGFKAEAEL